jgi:hypothetical protein
MNPRISGEESLLQDRAMGAHVIQASVHVCPIGGGAVKLFPSVLTWSLNQVGGNLLPRGEALHITVLSLQSFGTTHNNLHLVVSVSFHASGPQS